jgi:glycerophosphoryl diester phosphodiesterase
VLTIAHRGASRDAPENTLEAFALAVEQGADMIETDLHLTEDGEIVLVHDPEIGDTEIGRLPLEEVRRRLPTAPTLAETLDAFGDRIPFNLELKKGGEVEYHGLERRVLDQVLKRGLLEQTLFSSFYDSSLERLAKLEPQTRRGLLISRRAPLAIEERADRLEVEAVHPERDVLTPELLETLQVEGFRVHVFTVDDPADQKRLIDWGVDGIFTNTPRDLRELLDP